VGALVKFRDADTTTATISRKNFNRRLPRAARIAGTERSLDHLIGTQQQRLRDGEAERLRRLEVDDEL